MTDFARPARRTVMCASALLGSSALLAACGNGESAAPNPTPAQVPEPAGEAQMVLPLADLPEKARAQVLAKDPVTGEEIGVLLFRKDAKTVLAYSSICTHQGCAVTPKSSKDDFYCACHGSRFQPADGAVSAGPAIAALPRYACEIEGEHIAVYLGQA
ncbi:Rieske (2Fe-2S) protein [Glutamicibacter arilaitensis]|uniref:Rieske (2Fe-2S) protein n=1 Tax=Glutamicibacter arilaitensis TaxID=256701 RepID=UPI0038503F4B